MRTLLVFLTAFPSKPWVVHHSLPFDREIDLPKSGRAQASSANKAREISFQETNAFLGEQLRVGCRAATEGEFNGRVVGRPHEEEGQCVCVCVCVASLM